MIVEVRQHITGEGDTLIARIDPHEGPLPRPGDRLFHPAHSQADDEVTGTTAGLGVIQPVQSVTWLLYGRPRNGEEHFTRRSQVVVEVRLESI